MKFSVLCAGGLASLAIMSLTGCTSTQSVLSLSPSTQQTQPTQPAAPAGPMSQAAAAAPQAAGIGGPLDQKSGAPVAEGVCPPVTLLDDTSVRDFYLGGAKDDPKKLVYQATFADATRSCRSDGQTMTITVAVQGRLVPGSAAKPGKVVLPIRVTAADGDHISFDKSGPLEVEIPADLTGTQFLFSRADIAIPAVASRLTRIVVGFDNGPDKSAKINKKKKR